MNEIRTQADLDDRDSQTDEEVGQEVAPLVSPGDRHRGDVGDVVEADDVVAIIESDKVCQSLLISLL